MKKYKVIKLMTLAFEAGFKQASVVEAGLESKETDILVNWIYTKHVNENNKQ
jgi:hypothetical protein